MCFPISWLFYFCLDEQLANQEQELEREEEAFYEAKREAARVARLEKEKENQAKSNPAHNKSWANEDDWDMWEFSYILLNEKYGRLALCYLNLHVQSL